MPKKRSEPKPTLNQNDLDWIKDTLAKLIIENNVLRYVAAHLIVAKCKEADDPQLALRNLHGALDAAAQLAIGSNKPAGEQRLVEMYQPKIDELIAVAAKLLSQGVQRP